MATFLVYQVYYDQESQRNCLEFLTPYLNLSASPFFENQVIRDKYKDAEGYDYFGVVSHKLKFKMSYFPATRQQTVFNHNYLSGLTCDILFLQNNSGNMMQQLDDWHPGALAILRNIFEAAGLKTKTGIIKNVIYSNHFIARSEIYKDYVENFLIPCMEVMVSMKELWQNSNYTRLTGPPPERLQAAWGVDFWPLHTFLCERFFSVYLQDKNYKIERV